MAVKDKTRNYAQEKAAHKKPAYRKADAKRHKDRYAHEKKNGPIPKGMELHHTGRNATGKTKVIDKSANRRKQPPTKARGAARNK